MSTSLTERFGHKIRTAEELRDLIGPRPREQKVIMCHGVFDVVHPGHLRHLLYAKSKADVLVASLTADKHIDKGKYRPHVPQELRAANLAAFEMVDYVVIDKNPKPLDNIAVIQPDYFAKGYEYVADGLPPKTAEEADVVESYGGEIIFTPGDVVYSSSNLIDLAPPSLKLEKLTTLMEREGLILGSSSGFNVAGALRLTKKLGPGHTIVTILCDYGTRYQSKLLNPAFLREKGLPVPGWLEKGAA